MPTIGRIVIYRTDGRDGLSYDLPAIVNCTPDTHPGDYPCETCEGSGEVTERHEPWAAERIGCQDCGGTGKGARNPLPVPDHDCVHLTVFTPGGYGTAVVDGEGYEHHDPSSEQFTTADVLLPGSGTYVEWNVPGPASDDDPAPRSWRWPTRTDR